MKTFYFWRSMKVIQVTTDHVEAETLEEALKLANSIDEEHFGSLIESDWDTCEIFKDDLNEVTEDDIYEVEKD